MKNITAICCHFIWAVLPLLFISACNTKKNIPFPGDGSGSVQPVTRPFTYSESQPLKWKDINPDSIKPPTSIPIDLDKLPSKPFTVNDFKPLKNPIRQIKLDWDNIPDSAINLDTITERPFRLKKSLLPKPVIIKAGMPKLIPNTTSGILQFAEEEGLPGLEVSASLVDKNGMIWLATNNGLCRYTGDYIYSYHFLNKTPIGSDYAITRMTADKTGRIWLATAGDGVYVLDIDNGLVLHDRSKLFGAAIICDHAGNIWLACFNDALYVINPGKGTIKNTAPGTERKQENLVYSVIEDRYHNIWTGNPDRIGIIDSSRKKMKRLTKNEGLNISFAVEFFEDSRGDMWIGNLTRGLNFISLKNKTLSKIDTYNGFKGGAVKYTEDREGQIWIARRDTFYILNKQRTAIKNIVTNVRMIDQFYIGTSLTDQQGNIWVGSVDKGMIIIDPQGPLPEHLDTKNGLIDNNVWGILEDKDKKIWIGTYNGINIYDPQKDQLRVLGTDQGLGNNRIRRIMEFDGNEILATTQTGFSIINRDKKSLTNYGREQGLAGYYLTKALKDDSNRVWLNGFQGILIYDMAKNTQQLLDRSTGLLSNLVWDMVADRHGNIWAGSDSGICVINPVTNTIKYLRESEGLCNNIVQKMVVRDNGEIWIATQKGISVVNADKNTITNLTVSEGLVPEIIFDLLEQNNKMYAGSVDGLIVITQPDTSGNTGKKNTKWSFINYGKRQGFPFNDYNQNTGTATTNGQTWWGVTPVLTVVTQPVATDSIAPRVYITGINIMDESPLFSSRSALSEQLNTGDTLWYEAGKKYYLKNTLPKDSGYLSNKKIRWDSLTFPFQIPAGLVMPYDQNSLHFSFTNNDIKGRDKIVYRYILQGADKKWSDASDKTTTKNYYNLSPGKYIFKVSARGFNGLWSNPGELSFTITPPWWKTWWAYLLYIAVFSGLVWLIVQYRSRWLQKENRVLEEKVVHRTAQLHKSIEELKAAQSQLIQSEKMASLGELTAGIAHEIQNPLNFVNNFSEVNKELLVEMKDEMDKGNSDDAKAIANDVIDNEEKINHHGRRADAIVKGMLQHSRNSSGVKEPTNINALADEYLRLAYHGLRAKDKSFNATMKTDFDESIGNINIIPQDIGRVILNLINNGFYAASQPSKGGFSDSDKNNNPAIWVTTKKMEDKVLISVRDNGPGIPQKVLDKVFQPFFTTKPTGQGTGLGLSLSYDIIKAHGGEINVETKEGEGTLFIIKLPIP